MQLPKKIDSVVFCPLTDMQRSAYKKILSLDAVQNLVHKDAPCPCDSGSRCVSPRKPLVNAIFLIVF